MGKAHIPRFAEGQIKSALSEFPVVVVEGARQVGKSTTVGRICEELGGAYLSLDEEKDRLDLTSNLQGTLSRALGGQLVVIDEIQRMPSLIVDIKGAADKADRPGLFLLTGSGDRSRMVVDKKPLAGRYWQVMMRPLSQPEISAAEGGVPLRDGVHYYPDPNAKGSGHGIVNAMVSGVPPDVGRRRDLAKAISLGGYPRGVASPRQKGQFLSGYYQSDLLTLMSQSTSSNAVAVKNTFLGHVSKRIGKSANLSEIANEMGQGGYAAQLLYRLFYDTYVLDPLYGMRRRFRKKRVAVRPKLYLNDTGLATTVLGLDGGDLTKAPQWGALVENFVLAELRKDLELNHPHVDVDVSYYLEHDGIDIDLVLSCGPTHGLIPIEVKAADNVRWHDFRHVAEFRRLAGDDCGRGYVLYGGDEVVEYSADIQAWPISCLWSA